MNTLKDPIPLVKIKDSHPNKKGDYLWIEQKDFNPQDHNLFDDVSEDIPEEITSKVKK